VAVVCRTVDLIIQNMMRGFTDVTIVQERPFGNNPVVLQVCIRHHALLRNTVPTEMCQYGWLNLLQLM